MNECRIGSNVQRVNVVRLNVQDQIDTLTVDATHQGGPGACLIVRTWKMYFLNDPVSLG